MALGGGTFLTQNKILPGAYINFVSVANANIALSDRGTAAMPLAVGWGPTGTFLVTAGQFQRKSMELFGYDYSDDHIKGLRDLFLYAVKCYFYRIDGDGEKAKNNLATAKYPGTRGNDITVSVQTNVDDTSKFDVVTFVKSSSGNLTKVDSQTVTSADEIKDNAYVDFTVSELTATAGTPLAGGTDGTIEAGSYQKMLAAFDKAYFNTLGVPTSDEKVKSLVAAYTKRMRDEEGKKFQAVLFDYNKADHEGIISINPTNTVADSGANECDAVYWTTGVEAATAVNASSTNMKYDGEYTINVPEQENLEVAITRGEFTFHADFDENGDRQIYVLEDINTLTTLTETKGEVFQDNQCIRICDNIGNDIALAFKRRYVGKVINDDMGRTSFWTTLVKYFRRLQDIRAIQNFDPKDISVTQGEEKHNVVVDTNIEVTGTMQKLYMTVHVA